MKAPKVVVGWHDTGTAHGAFAASMTNMALYSGRMIYGVLREPGPYVAQSRNIIVEKFLKHGGDYLLMVDADEEFPPDSLYRTLSVYQMSGADILFGNYALGDGSPSLFKLADGVQIPQHIWDLEPCMLYEIDAGATGWMFASREALLKIGERYRHDPWRFFNHDLETTEGTTDAEEQMLNHLREMRLGEDISFSKRCRETGLKIVGYTGILIVHNKNQQLICHFMKEYGKAAGLNID